MDLWRRRSTRRWRLLLPVVWTGAVLAASVVAPGGAGGATGGGVGPGATGPLGLAGADKWLHAAAYAVLAFLVAAALDARGRRALALAVLATVAVGAGVEVVQAPLATRSADVADAAANAAGAVVGAGIWLAVARRAAG